MKNRRFCKSSSQDFLLCPPELSKDSISELGESSHNYTGENISQWYGGDPPSRAAYFQYEWMATSNHADHSSIIPKSACKNRAA